MQYQSCPARPSCNLCIKNWLPLCLHVLVLGAPQILLTCPLIYLCVQNLIPLFGVPHRVCFISISSKLCSCPLGLLDNAMQEAGPCNVTEGSIAALSNDNLQAEYTMPSHLRSRWHGML